MRVEPAKKASSIHPFLCALIWFISNAILGLAPLIFLGLVNLLIDNELVSHEITVLIKGGMILFISCALMGAVVIDINFSKLHYTKWAYFYLNLSPFVLLFIASLIYLLIVLGHTNAEIFTNFSKFYTFFLLFTIIYCILGKYLLYAKERA